MRYLRILYGTDSQNTKMEDALIYLLRIFGYKPHFTGYATPSDDRLIIFEKKDI